MLAYQHLNDFNNDQTVDWALEMLTLGYDTPSLLILAGISKPTNFFEAERSFVNTFHLSIYLLILQMQLFYFF